jgi:hypothetical protein
MPDRVNFSSWRRTVEQSADRLWGHDSSEAAAVRDAWKDAFLYARRTPQIDHRQTESAPSI